MKAMLLSVMVAMGSSAAIPAIARDSQTIASPSFKREAVEITFDRNKGALYALYSRALREQPGLAGKIVFEIDIDASGRTTACRVKSSELNAPDLERKLRERIATFRYPTQGPATITKPIDFFPAR